MRRASLAVMQWVARERAMGGARQAHLTASASAAAAADTMPLMRCRDRRQREQGSWEYYKRGHGTWQYYVGGGGTGVMLGAMGIFGKSAAKEDAADKELLREADALYDAGRKRDVKKLLEGKGEAMQDNAEVLWRLARAYFDEAEALPDTKASRLDKKRLCEKALAIVKTALDKSEGSFAVHKWFGIILNAVSGHEGTTSKIKNSFIVREHWDKAFALNPQPGFWLSNWLNIAKCYKQLKDKDETNKWLTKLVSVSEGKIVTEEDKKVVAEAKTLLGK